MILSEDSPFYKDLPGLSVLLGGMWIMNISYWGFNQYIIQRALAAKNIGEAQKGVLFAAFLKLLMPVIVVLPGIAAVVLAPDLAKPDQAYPTVMHLLPTGILGLVFAALVAAIVASLASKINSMATIFTLDFYAKGKAEQDQQKLVQGRPHRGGDGGADRHPGRQALARQLRSGLPVHPGIHRILHSRHRGDLHARFVLETRQRSRCAGCRHRLLRLSIVLKLAWPALPFIDRVGLVFLLALALAVGVSLATRPAPEKDIIRTDDVDYATSSTFNIGALGVLGILIALYAVFW
jgi:SSS family solute:Na+ symporter